VYALPDELGAFDVAIMAAVLRHTRNPLNIIESCAAHAETLVITEMHRRELDGAPVTCLVPAPGSTTWDTWWDFSPDFLTQFLGVLGFDQMAVSYHEQRFVAHATEHLMPMFTLVASRSSAGTNDGRPGVLGMLRRYPAAR
jgi:O-methyltransferase